jgi:hypothetical protein
MASCAGSLIRHVDGSIAACSNDETGDCAGLQLRHEGDPIVCWKWSGRCDKCGIQLADR